jgi:predicted component of type VI protein secretion system
MTASKSYGRRAMNKIVAIAAMLGLLAGCTTAKVLKPGEVEIEVNGGQTIQHGQPNSYSQGGAIHLHYPLGGN